jgi:hypothetical protein
MGLGEAYRAAGSEHRAALERDAARTLLDAIQAGPTRASTAPPAALPAHDPRQPAANAFRREGDHWLVVFDGVTVHVRDLKGMRYLARLLADPGREHHVLDLVAAESGGTSGAAPGDAGALLDDRAKEAYRRRLAEIDEDIDDARALGDEARTAQAEAEHDFLVRELARAFGLGGRERRAASASERGRVAVTRAIRQTMARITEHHAVLGEHLDRAIRTGTYCAYDPDPRAPTRWDL